MSREATLITAHEATLITANEALQCSLRGYIPPNETGEEMFSRWLRACDAGIRGRAANSFTSVEIELFHNARDRCSAADQSCKLRNSLISAGFKVPRPVVIQYRWETPSIWIYWD